MTATTVSPSCFEKAAADFQDPKVTDLDEEAAETQRQEEANDSSPAGVTQETTGGRTKQNRLEKKSRKALSRLGLKPVQGIMKVTIRKSKHVSSFYRASRFLFVSVMCSVAFFHHES